MNRRFSASETLWAKFLVMKSTIRIVYVIMCLAVQTSTLFSQNSELSSKFQTSETAGIQRVVPNLEQHNVLVTFANLDTNGEYHVLLYDFNKQLMGTYWVDGNQMAIYVGSIAPNNYTLVLKKDNKVIDKKEILIQ